MDTSRNGAAAGGLSSRLPTKKNSLHLLHETNLDRRALTTSPSATSDTSSISDTAAVGAAANGNGGQHSFDSRRSSTSSQQSDIRGRTSTGRPGQTRIPRPSPSAQTTHSNPTPRRPLTIKDAYRMAEEEEAAAVAAAAQGSPSPAPRPWRSRAGGGGLKSTPAPGASAGAAAATTGISGRATPMSVSESRMQKILSQSPLDIGGRRTARRIAEPMFQGVEQQHSHSRGISEDSTQSVATNSTSVRSERGNITDMRRIRHEEDQARIQVAKGERAGGLFSPKARVSPKIAVAGRELHRRASNSSLSDKSKVPGSVTTARTLLPASRSSLGASVRSKPSYLKRMASAPDNVAPKVEDLSAGLGGIDSSGDLGLSGSSPPVPPKTRLSTVQPRLATVNIEPALISSPGKSFAWDADEDFTAGDLMVSESPPLKNRGQLATSDALERPLLTKSPESRPKNTKLEEIRQLEIDAELRFPDAMTNEDRNADLDEIFPGSKNVDVDKGGEAVQQARRSGFPAERKNKTIDEIRARENEGSSRRAVSAAKLDEIRQRNAEFRAPPLESSRKVSYERLRAETTRYDQVNDGAITRARDRSVFDDEGERIPNTPVTIYRTLSTSSSDRGRRLANSEDNQKDKDPAKNTSVSPADSRKSSSSTHSRNESQELLRKLARVSTSVVAAAERKDKGPASPKKLRDRLSIEGGQHGGGSGAGFGTERMRSREADTLRPTVGFAELRRVSSTESASTKRSSVAQSDSDPIDRIEAEIMLFAPTENHSERGSIRAPSPDEDADEGSATGAKDAQTADDATPKPTKINPIMQPTPRVTGAYVETPVTARTEKMQEMINTAEPSTAAATAGSTAERQAPQPPIMPLLRNSAAVGTAEDGTGTRKESDTAHDEAAAVKSDVAARTRRLPAARQRSRSRSTSRLVSRTRSPLLNSAMPVSARDDLLAIQRNQQMDDSTLDDFDELLVAHGTITASDEAPSAVDCAVGATDSERLRRMSQSINTYILDVQTAKKGIERLEDRVSHPQKETTALAELGKKVTGDERQEGKEDNQEGRTAAKIKQEEVSDVYEPDLDNATATATLTKRQTHKCRSASVTPVAVPKKEPDASTRTVPAATEGKLETVSYARIPLPRLYRSGSQNKKRLTFLGIVVLILSMWFAAETTTCALYCRPDACQSGQVCRWSPDDPSFGVAIPVKIDQWLTGGQGRILAAWAGDELGDLMADAWDAATGTDIRHVDSTYFSFEEKRRHRRRLQKKGLVQPWKPSQETLPKLEVWRRAREARAREEQSQEKLGAYGRRDYDDDDDDDGFEEIVSSRTERMASDEKVRGWW